MVEGAGRGDARVGWVDEVEPEDAEVAAEVAAEVDAEVDAGVNAEVGAEGEDGGDERAVAGLFRQGRCNQSINHNQL